MTYKRSLMLGSVLRLHSAQAKIEAYLKFKIFKIFRVASYETFYQNIF